MNQDSEANNLSAVVPCVPVPRRPRINLFFRFLIRASNYPRAECRLIDKEKEILSVNFLLAAVPFGLSRSQRNQTVKSICAVYVANRCYLQSPSTPRIGRDQSELVFPEVSEDQLIDTRSGCRASIRFCDIPQIKCKQIRSAAGTTERVINTSSGRFGKHA